MSETDKVKIREADGQGPIQDFLAEQSAKHSVWLVGGTIPLEADDTNKVRGACLLFNDQGQRVARYDKIHLFDVDLAGGESYRESRLYRAGTAAAVADLPWARLGLSICYDVRFPHLYRSLAQSGATVIAIPAAFTRLTGEAHWHVLVRARAIETGAYVIAAAQGGARGWSRDLWAFDDYRSMVQDHR